MQNQKKSNFRFIGKRRARLLDEIKCMPPLSHSVEGEEFNIKHSRVMNWVMKHPAAWEYIWNNIKQSGSIIYDPETKKWRGVDYVPEDNYEDGDSDVSPDEKDSDHDGTGEGDRTEKKWKAGSF